MADISIIFFNNPTFSDTILKINGEQYYVASELLEKHTKLFTSQTKIDSQNISSGEVILSIISKNVITIEDANLKSDVVIAVLKSIYGIPLDITVENAIDIYRVSFKLQMKNIIDECIDILRKNLRIKTLMDDYLKAINEKSPLTLLFGKLLKGSLCLFEKDSALAFTEKIPLEFFYSFLFSDVSCSESLKYEIADNYCDKNSISKNEKIDIMSKIDLSKVSGELLVTKAKINPHIDSSNYQNVLENFVRENKVDIAPIIFRIGKYDEKYDGYRLITAAECKSSQFVKIFGEHYRKNNGLQSLDDFMGDMLCNDKYPLCITNINYGSCIRLRGIEIKKNKIIKFKCTHCTENELDNKLEFIGLYDTHVNGYGIKEDSIGLFVPINIKF